MKARSAHNVGGGATSSPWPGPVVTAILGSHGALARSRRHRTGADRVSRQAWASGKRPRFRFTTRQQRITSYLPEIDAALAAGGKDQAWLHRKIQGSAVLPPDAHRAHGDAWNGGHGECPANPQPRSDASGFGRGVKLTRFRGHRTVCVQGVHDGQDKIALRT